MVDATIDVTRIGLALIFVLGFNVGAWPMLFMWRLAIYRSNRMNKP